MYPFPNFEPVCCPMSSSNCWRSSFPHSQSLPSGSLPKPPILIHQRADRMKTTITENHSLPVSKHQSSILIGFSENQKVFEQDVISFNSGFFFFFWGPYMYRPALLFHSNDTMISWKIGLDHFIASCIVSFQFLNWACQPWLQIKKGNNFFKL